MDTSSLEERDVAAENTRHDVVAGRVRKEFLRGLIMRRDTSHRSSPKNRKEDALVEETPSA
jgi:hypothetical protein